MRDLISKKLQKEKSEKSTERSEEEREKKTSRRYKWFSTQKCKLYPADRRFSVNMFSMLESIHRFFLQDVITHFNLMGELLNHET